MQVDLGLSCLYMPEAHINMVQHMFIQESSKEKSRAGAHILFLACEQGTPYL